MSDLSETPKFAQTVEPISVDTDGNVYTDFTREKESIIRGERLDSIHPLVEVDLESILTEQDGSAIAVVIQDFGLPPRIIEVRGDFTDMRDVSAKSRDIEHYKSAPKTLFLTTNTPNNSKTYVFDDKSLPTTGYPVELSRGESMLWAHDGFPSDERTGYIGGDSFWELTALRSQDYYGDSRFSDLERVGVFITGRGFVPFIGITYEGSVLSIYSLDDVHADVLYQQVRSLDDAEDVISRDHSLASLNWDEIVTRLRSGDDSVLEVLKGVEEERSEALTALDGIKVQLAETRAGIDNLETLLAGNKRKLRDSRQEAANLAREVQKLQRETSTSSQSQKANDTLFDILGGRHATESDPHGHCSVIGLDPTFLFSLTPEVATRVVKGVHRGLVMGFHSDIHDKGDEEMKAINVAVDSILERVQQGYWGRH